MNYATLENEIVSRLNSSTDLAAMADAKALPDSLDDYKTPFAKGLVTVVFAGEKHDSNQSISEVSQHFTIVFNISVQSRLLRGEKGVYVISEKVKDLLEGFRLSDCGALQLKSHDFIGYQNDIWEHSIILSCRSLRTQIDSNPLPDQEITGADEEVFYVPPNITINENIQV